MHQGLPSLTAVYVAAARALASGSDAAVCDPDDRAARHLLPRVLDSAIGTIEHHPLLARWLPKTLAASSMGLVDHLALRACAIDTALERALSRGVTQVVILGAGLDSRAHRMPELHTARVFEIDHPDSQAHKRVRAMDLPIRAAQLRYVPVDFERNSLAQALAEHGHVAEEATFWIWEGVVPYLDKEAVRATLTTVAERSASGSELAATYVTDQLFWFKHTRPLLSAGLSLIGEPMRSAFDPERFAQLLRETGFTPFSDTHTHDWWQQFHRSGAHKALMAYEHLALASKP